MLTVSAVIAATFLFSTVTGGAQQHADETGTLNIAIRLSDGVVLTSDSGINSSVSDPNQKLARVGKSSGCAVEGHLNDRDLANHKIFRLNEALTKYGVTHPSQDLSSSFPALVEVIKSVLTRTNQDRKDLHEPLLRQGEGEEDYRASDGTYYVSGLICVGAVHGKPSIRAAHFVTTKSGEIMDRVDTVGDFVAQGGENQVVNDVFRNGNWPRIVPPSPEPTWFTFQSASNALKILLASGRPLSDLPLATARAILVGVYWSSIVSSQGVVRAPIRIWTLSKGSATLEMEELGIPDVESK